MMVHRRPLEIAMAYKELSVFLCVLETLLCYSMLRQSRRLVLHFQKLVSPWKSTC
jgi:hypothetical protein